MRLRHFESASVSSTLNDQTKELLAAVYTKELWNQEENRFDVQDIHKYLKATINWGAGWVCVCVREVQSENRAETAVGGN